MTVYRITRNGQAFLLIVSGATAFILNQAERKGVRITAEQAQSIILSLK